MAIGELHLAYFTALLLVPLYALFWFRQAATRMHQRHWRAMASTFAGLAPGILVIVWSQLHLVQDSVVAAGRALTEISYFSPHAWQLVTRSNPSSTFENEQQVYLGISVVVLVIVGLLIFFTRRRSHPLPGQRLNVLFFAGVFTLFTVVALGLSNSFSAFVYKIFYSLVPYWSFARVPGRMMYIVLGALAILLGFATQAILRWVEDVQRSQPRWPHWFRWSTILFIFILAVVVVDLRPMRPNFLQSRPPKNSVTQKLQELSTDSAPPTILYVPVYVADHQFNSLWEFYATEWPLPFLNGYSPTAPQVAQMTLQHLMSLNDGQLLPDQVALLTRLHVSYVVIDSSVLPDENVDRVVAAFQNSQNFRNVSQEAGWYLYQFSP